MTDNEFAKEIRLFNLGNYLLQRWQDIRCQFNRESEQLGRRYAMVSGGAERLANLGFYGAYAWTILKTVQRAISIGDFTLYTGAFQQSQTTRKSLLFNVAHIYEFNL